MRLIGFGRFKPDGSPVTSDGRRGSPVLLELKYRFLMARLRRHRRKQISAMLRVKNEEELLYPAVKSIADHVEEIVIVDNLSTDGTPSVIETLRREHPGKIVSHTYPYEIRRVGSETWELAAEPATHSSPHLSANFYNWCLRRCTKPYVLKWDADMLARDAFYRALDDWRASPKPILMFRGANVHPDLEHLVAARSTDRVSLLASLRVPGLPLWVTSLTYDALEPRLFPRAFARYDSTLLWTQYLSSPFREKPWEARSCHQVKEICFLHLKFCKRDPFSNYSGDLGEVIASNIAVGPLLSPEDRDLLRRWRVAAPTA